MNSKVDVLLNKIHTLNPDNYFRTLAPGVLAKFQEREQALELSSLYRIGIGSPPDDQEIYEKMVEKFAQTYR